MSDQVNYATATVVSCFSRVGAVMAAGGQVAGSQPQRRRTRHSGVDVMEALDDPDVMLRADPNLTPKPTPQVPPQAASSALTCCLQLSVRNALLIGRDKSLSCCHCAYPTVAVQLGLWASLPASSPNATALHFLITVYARMCVHLR